MTLLHLAINLTTPLLAAKLIASMRRQGARYGFRVVFVIPMIVPWMVITLIWKFMYVAEIGVINQALRAVGLDAWTHAWLSEPATALYAIGLMNFPWISGLYFLIYYAGLANVPRELQEAARVDGAGALRQFFGIEVPLITGQIKLVVILTIIGWLQNYSNVLVMTGGGPFQSTMMPGLWMYLSAFKYSDWGYACAIGVFLFAVIFAVTYLNNRFLKSSVEYE
jgi:raffinose/stachyose/melibiose transport system permease protein